MFMFGFDARRRQEWKDSESCAPSVTLGVTEQGPAPTMVATLNKLGQNSGRRVQLRKRNLRPKSSITGEDLARIADLVRCLGAEQNIVPVPKADTLDDAELGTDPTLWTRTRETTEHKSKSRPLALPAPNKIASFFF